MIVFNLILKQKCVNQCK